MNSAPLTEEAGKQYLTQQELAHAFRVPRQRVLAWQRAGAPCYNVTPGAKRVFYRYVASEIAQWLKEQAAEGHTGKEATA